MGRSPLNVDFRVVMLDETDEAPGVQGIGIPRLVFWVWQDGDGHSPNGMTRDPWFGTYWKVQSSSEFTHQFFFFLAREVGHARDRNRRGPLPRRIRLLNICLILISRKINYRLARVHPVQLPQNQIPSLNARQFLGELKKSLFIGATCLLRS